MVYNRNPQIITAYFLSHVKKIQKHLAQRRDGSERLRDPSSSPLAVILARCLVVQHGCLSSSHGVSIPDSTMEEESLPIQHLPLPSRQPEPSHISSPGPCLPPVPNKGKGGRTVLALCLPGQPTARDDFTIYCRFQAGLPLEKIPRACRQAPL